jgi:Biopolymer transport protein ExbD/TolR
VNFRNRTSTEVVIDLTSLIDVVFILLLFFMVSTTFERPAAMKITLPEASAEAELADPVERLELVIDKDGKMFLNDQQLVDDRVKTLVAAFTQAVGWYCAPTAIRPIISWSGPWTLRPNWDLPTCQSPPTDPAERTNDFSFLGFVDGDIPSAVGLYAALLANVCAGAGRCQRGCGYAGGIRAVHGPFDRSCIRR